jgi:hypothetical protein
MSLLEDARLARLLDPPVPFADAAALYAELDTDPGARLQSVLRYAPLRFDRFRRFGRGPRRDIGLKGSVLD